MARKPRREEVQKLIKSLLDLEIPEIQNVARQLTERIKQLEEHSLKLQNYVTQIESLAEEEADALVDTKIHELVTGLEKALGERRQKPKPVVAEPRVEAKPKDVEVAAKAEVELEDGEKTAKVKLKRYMTPDGMVIRKSRL